MSTLSSLKRVSHDGALQWGNIVLAIWNFGPKESKREGLRFSMSSLWQIRQGFIEVKIKAVPFNKTF